MPFLSRAFTLIDLLTCVALASILLGIGVPALMSMVHDQRVRSASLGLLQSAMLARNESIKRRQPVLVRARDKDWSKGWEVFVDLNDNAQREPHEPLLAQRSAPGGVIIKGNSPVAHYLRYTPTGQTKRLGGAFQAGTVTICHINGKQSVRRLVLSSVGRLRSVADKPGGC